MWSRFVAVLAFVLHQVHIGYASSAIAHDPTSGVTYKGIVENDIEVFYGISYGLDTGGEHRFRPPRLAVAPTGSVVNATRRGPACPQQKGAQGFPLYLANITDISENCLSVNIYRHAGIFAGAKLPVMLFIHGGSFVYGSKEEPVIQPEGLIRQSVVLGSPVISVNINYRLGVFGFAQSEALKAERSENAGLRDQRLAIEWTRRNIACFGGDPDRIEILGQSSGGLAIGMQMLAFGGGRQFDFHQASAESQILEGGITGDFTLHAMEGVARASGCNMTGLQSSATIECLRSLNMEELLMAQVSTYHDGPAANIGDYWLPVVDGDFLPAAPSELISQGRFANVTTMIGWCEDDATFFVDYSLHSEAGVHDYFTKYLPGMTQTNLHKLLALYPTSDFQANPAANLSAQVYRAGRILRDIAFTSQPLLFGRALHDAGNDVYLWTQNQTMFGEILTSLGQPGFGVVHTSNFAYEFHNLSHYDVDGFPYQPNASDFALAKRQSRSWATFANTGRPSHSAVGTLEGWGPAFKADGEIDVYVIGGPHEGLSALNGPSAEAAVASQKLQERSRFLNSPEIVAQINF